MMASELRMKQSWSTRRICIVASWQSALVAYIKLSWTSFDREPPWEYRRRVFEVLGGRLITSRHLSVVSKVDLLELSTRFAQLEVRRHQIHICVSLTAAQRHGSP